MLQHIVIVHTESTATASKRCQSECHTTQERKLRAAKATQAPAESDTLHKAERVEG